MYRLVRKPTDVHKYCQPWCQQSCDNLKQITLTKLWQETKLLHLTKYITQLAILRENSEPRIKYPSKDNRQGTTITKIWDKGQTKATSPLQSEEAVQPPLQPPYYTITRDMPKTGCLVRTGLNNTLVKFPHPK